MGVGGTETALFLQYLVTDTHPCPEAVTSSFTGWLCLAENKVGGLLALLIKRETRKVHPDYSFHKDSYQDVSTQCQLPTHSIFS